ncbi:sulfite exporter TauE/SafE family protein [Acidihalobacter prosperus]
MDIFLPIAHMDVNLILIVFFGAIVGFLSGLVGVGGGFLITPLLLFIGVPPLVAVASGAAQIVGTSASGSYAHWRLGNVDFRMAFALLVGSWTGGAVGVHVAHTLQAGGHFGTIVTFLYVGLLGIVGTSMLFESLNALRGKSKSQGTEQTEDRAKKVGWMARIPLQMDFPVSQLRVSVIAPIAIGFGVGILTSLMGVGGGFIMVPVMIYLLRMPTKVVVGTSLFQLLFTTAEVSILQAGVNQAVDPFLALILVIGSALGTQWGTRLGARLPGEQLRLILALVVVAVAVKMLFGIVIKPHDIYSLVLAR